MIKFAHLFKSQKGVIPPIVLIAGVGLIIFIIIAATTDFKDKLFGSIYEKPKSQAATYGYPTPSYPSPLPIIEVVLPDNGTSIAKGTDNSIIAMGNNIGTYTVLIQWRNKTTNKVAAAGFTKSTSEEYKRYVAKFDTSSYNIGDQVEIWAEVQEPPQSVPLAKSNIVSVTITKSSNISFLDKQFGESLCSDGKPAIAIAGTLAADLDTYSIWRLKDDLTTDFLVGTVIQAGIVDYGVTKPLVLGKEYKYRVKGYKSSSPTPVGTTDTFQVRAPSSC